jgi:hypothetical protein
MDQAKAYVVPMMSNCSVDVVHGFGALAGCHTMEFDYVSASNYNKISKNIATLLWKLNRSSNVNNGMSNKHFLVLMEGFVGGKLFHYEHLPDRDFLTIKKARRSLEDLRELMIELDESLEVHSFIKGMFSVALCQELETIFDSIRTVERIAAKFSPAIKDHSTIIIHFVNVLKHALLNDPVEARASSQSLIKIYDEMLNYNTLSLGFLSSATLLFFALGLNSELSQLLSIAQRMSVFFPGCKVIVERFALGNTSEVAKWNPFTGILEKVQSLSLQRDPQNIHNQVFNNIVIQSEFHQSEPSTSYSSSNSPSDHYQQVSQAYNEDNSDGILESIPNMEYVIQEEDYLFAPLY